jgi:hypothetical protein
VNVNEAETRLNEILKTYGFNVANPSPSIAWAAFKNFAAEPVECQDDGILFQVGCYDFSGKNLCYFEFVRQFSISDEENGYDHMEQLHLQFKCDPTSELMDLKTNLWAYDFKSLDEYFDKVESLPEFQKSMKHMSWDCIIYQELV